MENRETYIGKDRTCTKDGEHQNHENSNFGMVSGTGRARENQRQEKEDHLELEEIIEASGSKLDEGGGHGPGQRKIKEHGDGEDETSGSVGETARKTKQPCGRAPPALGLVGCLGRGRRKTEGVLVADSLVGIHPHPGSTRRGVRSRGEGRRRRNEARRERRRRGGRRGERLGVGTGVGILGLMALLLVVTWNVRRLSVRETNRRRLRSVAERVRQERWEMVLLTELRADEEGVVWLGEDEERVVLINGKKAGVMLRGEGMTEERKRRMNV